MTPKVQNKIRKRLETKETNNKQENNKRSKQQTAYKYEIHLNLDKLKSARTYKT